MKRLPIITSIQSKLRFSDDELKQTFVQSRATEIDSEDNYKVYNGFETFPHASAGVTLKGNLHIAFFNSGGKSSVIELPAITEFLVTGIEEKDGSYKYCLASSLS